MIVIHADHRRCSRCRCFKTRDEFHAKNRNRDGTIRNWQSRCKDCMREVTRVRAGVASRGRPYEPRKRARTRREHVEQRRRAWRERREHETAQERTTRMVLARIDANLRRDAGLDYPQRTHWRDVMVIEPYQPRLSAAERLDAAPFIAWLRACYPGQAAEQIGRALRVTPRTVRALLNGEQHRVRLTFVDRAVTSIGRPDLLDDLYPLT